MQATRELFNLADKPATAETEVHHAPLSTVPQFCEFLDWASKSELQHAIGDIKVVINDPSVNGSHRRVCKKVLKVLQAEMREHA